MFVKPLLTNIFICVITSLSGRNANEKLLVKGVIQALKADGWFEVNTVGNHHQFKHPDKKGRVTVKHPDKDIPARRWTALNDSLGCSSGSPDLLTDFSVHGGKAK